jgi:hypothetical protein
MARLLAALGFALGQAASGEAQSGERGIRVADFLRHLFSNQLACRRLAPTAASAHGQLHLHFAQAGGTLLDDAPDLTIGDPVTQTNIHREPFAGSTGHSVIRMRMIVNYT